MRLSTAAILRERQEERIESMVGVVKAVMRNTGKPFNEICNVMEIPESERGAILEFLEKGSQEKKENSEEVSEKGEAVL